MTTGAGSRTVLSVALILGLFLGTARLARGQDTETDRQFQKQFEKHEKKTKQPDAPPTPSSAVPAPNSGQPAVPGRAARPAPSNPSDSDAPLATAAQGWSIILGVFRGDDQIKQAQMGLAKIQAETNLASAYMQRRGGATVVALGNYPTPETPQAQAELKRVQGVEVMQDGKQVKPFETAYLSPPPVGEATPGAMPEYNLANAKAKFGPDALYTLQIAVYGRNDVNFPSAADLAEARKAAETAVYRLRQEGEQAFYYHGSRLSMVTIGVFGPEDFDPQTPGFQSPRLIAAKKRHPYNLLNGAGILVKFKSDKASHLESSRLVAIPDK